MRKFVRHPGDIPVDLHIMSDQTGAQDARLHDVSVAGANCILSTPLNEGAEVEIRVPSVTDLCFGRGTVAWCRPCQGCFQVGVRFADAEDAYRARMVEQLCQIEAYRRELESASGQYVDGEQAAAEWIDRFAADFASSFCLPHEQFSP